MAGFVGFLGFCVAVFAFLMMILANALNDWHLKVEYVSGLWNVCSRGSCNDFQEVSSDLKAVRAMVILSMILTAVAIIGSVLNIFLKMEKKEINIGICGVLLVSGLFLMTGFGIYIDKIYSQYKDNDSGAMLGSGLACCIVAWLACWLSGALLAIEEYAGKEEIPGGSNTNPPTRGQ